MEYQHPQPLKLVQMCELQEASQVKDVHFLSVITAFAFYVVFLLNSQ